MISVSYCCTAGHVSSWRLRPVIRHIPAANILCSVAILLSGSTVYILQNFKLFKNSPYSICWSCSISLHSKQQDTTRWSTRFVNSKALEENRLGVVKSLDTIIQDSSYKMPSKSWQSILLAIWMLRVMKVMRNLYMRC